MTIQEKALKLKYIKNNLETTINHAKVIQALYGDEYFKECLTLKGGAATQIYLQDFKRLFFDLDIDFAFNIEKREYLRNYLLNYMNKLGYQKISPKSRFSYSLDSYRFPYYLENHNIDHLKLDINYSYGSHLYKPEHIQITNSDFELNQIVSVVKLEELLGMKLTALQVRRKIKDLFDVYQILNSNLTFDFNQVKEVYLFYMTISNYQDKINEINNITGITNNDVKRKLYPIIPKESSPNLELMKKEVLSYVKECSILTPAQNKFIINFSKGYNTPEYLFQDEQTIINALNNPIAKWKMKIIKRK